MADQLMQEAKQKGINPEVLKDIQKLKETFETHYLSRLMMDFKWFQPNYVSRGTPKDVKASKENAVTRLVTSLYDEVTGAIFAEEPRLTVEASRPQLMDLNEVRSAHGGRTIRGNQNQADYLITIDDKFEQFTQNLSYAYGGAKPKVGTHNRQGTPTGYSHDVAQALRPLFQVSEKNTKGEILQAVDDFLTVYVQNQRNARLPNVLALIDNQEQREEIQKRYKA